MGNNHAFYVPFKYTLIPLDKLAGKTMLRVLITLFPLHTRALKAVTIHTMTNINPPIIMILHPSTPKTMPVRKNQLEVHTLQEPFAFPTRTFPSIL